ncbi:CCA-adding enzyme [Macrococcus hajekii]|nr:CCA tRNA nucleotidyltransferase [Macrococcus hajekii]GGB05690.1 CCA-adding enzyme [Macrococcus hajekii]
MDKLKTALPVLERLNDAGHEAYIVGGAVRNYLLDLTLNDIDITTSALPDEVEALFERTVPIGKEHGTIMVIMDETFEVTTFRVDGDYIDHRRPDHVIFVKNLKEDLIRRDFTINAMALDESMHVVDYVGGREDINRRLIRAVGVADDRFAEDALRMIRAARFQSVLDFQIEDVTYEAMKNNASLIQHVAIERIITEFTKLLQGLNPAAGIQSLATCGLMRHIPLFRTCSSLFQPERPVSLEVYIAYHLFTAACDDHEIKSLKLSNDSIKTIKNAVTIMKILSHQPDSDTLKMLVFKYPLSLIESCRAVVGSDSDVTAIYQSLPIYNRQSLVVDGHALISHLDVKPGPWLKYALADIEQAVVTGRLHNDRDTILEWVEQHVEI